MSPNPTLRAALIAGSLFAGATALSAPPEPEIRIPLVIHLTRKDGAPVIAPKEVLRLVEQLDDYYRQTGICFALKATREVPRDADLKTYRDRHAFIGYAVPRAINVVLVNSIFDPETSESTLRTAARFGFKPDPWLDGAHIEKPGRNPSSYAIVRVGADPTTMAHEIGHILGEGHSGVAENIMGYGSNPTVFDQRQIRGFRAEARREIRAGSLREADHCGASAVAR